MDAVKLFKEMNRICEHYSNCDGGCPLKVWCNKGLYLLSENPEEVIETVEKWSAEHPKKTRQSEFLKMFPNACTDYAGVIDICTKNFDCNIGNELCAKHETCNDCRKEYWSEEVDE